MQELKEITRTITDAVAALKAKFEQAGYAVKLPNEQKVWNSGEERTVAVEPVPHTLKDVVPDFGTALKNAGFIEHAVDAVDAVVLPPPEGLDTTPEIYQDRQAEPVTPPQSTPTPTPMVAEVPGHTETPVPEKKDIVWPMTAEEEAKLGELIKKYKSKRDDFCKAAKGLVVGMRSEELRAYYTYKREQGMADGTWPKPLTPTQRKKLAEKELAPRPTIEQIIMDQETIAVCESIVGADVTEEPQAVNGFTESAIPTATVPSFNEQVQAIRKAEVDKLMNAQQGKIEGQIAQDAAGNKYNSLLQLAQTQARALGANGPVSIDEVTAAMSATANVMPVKGGHVNSWKGKVFPKSEWVCVGSKPTSMASSHARHVSVWALKSWLKTNSLNGTAASVSAYNLFSIYRSTSKLHYTLIKTNAEKFSWFIGDETLSPDLRSTITKDNNTLYGIPVSFIPGAVGAVLMPPDPSRAMAKA